MKTTRTFGVLFGTLAASGILWAASAQAKAGSQEDGFTRTTFRYEDDKKAPPGVVFVSADDAKYKETAPGVTTAVISGDPDKGAHRIFTKFAPGTSVPLHTHSSELHIVVIKGAYLYQPEKGEEKRVGPGCFLTIPAGDRHASGSDAKEGVLFYEESTGKFDLVPVEKK